MTSPEITDAAVPTDDDFRAIGFTKEARNWPRDELAVKLIAAFNGVPADDLPSLAWRYFPNKQTAEAWKRVADAALAAGAPGVKVPENELLAERDRFIVSKGLWPEFVATLPPGVPAPSALVAEPALVLAKRPVAFRVKDHADGWILFQDEDEANAEAEYTGALMQGLYVRDGTPMVAEPGEPVAWEQRHRENSGEWSEWYPTSKKAFDLIGTEPDGSLQARPLYAAPPARQDGALREALVDAAAHLRGAASAYREHAARHRSVGRAKPDPFFTTRVGDFEKAADRAVAALAQSAAPVQQAAPSDEGE